MKITHHAQTRMRQRNVPYSAIQFVIEYGHEIRKQGHYFYCLPQGFPIDEHRLKNLVVIANPDSSIKTVYYSVEPLKHIKSKSKYHRH